MPTVIVQRGVESAGKTSTIRAVYELLLAQYPDALIESRLDNDVEIRVVLTIAGVRIGIESLGDPWKKAARLDPSLSLFVRLRCDVIVCATRTFGGTVNSVLALEEQGYEIIWRDRTPATFAEHHAVNMAEARWVVEHIESEFLQVAH